MRASLILLVMVLLPACGSGFTGRTISSVTVIPPPTITIPTTSSVSTNGSAVTLSGACVTGYELELSGDDSQTTTCSAGTYSFTISKSSDATYDFSILQSHQGVSSTSITQQWVRDTSLPAVPTVTLPALNPYYSSTGSITLSGTCESGATVSLGGASTDSTSCASGSYSFLIVKSTQSNFNFTVNQTDSAGNSSSSTAFTWVRDTTAPSAPVVSNPPSSPYTSGSSSLTISGTCENNATVNLSGDASNSMTCASGAYSFNVSKAANTTYNFTLSQTDRAGNASTSSTVQWIKSATVPPTPTITAPTENPKYTSGNSLVISGACVTGNPVNMTGDDTQSMTCAGSAYTFTVNAATDATRNYSITQTDSGSGFASGAIVQAWTRDTVAPGSPVVSSPATATVQNNGSTLNISGTCDAGTVSVELSGSAIATSDCSGGTYSFNINKSADATYVFEVIQIDFAGNDSPATTITWIRDTSAPASPTITSLATNPVYTNGSSIVISGACETGATVNLTGDSAQTMTCAGSAYSFTVNKAADATYSFSLAQTDGAGNSSGVTSQSWVRDTSLPAVPVITSPASSPYRSNGSAVNLTGTCETGATVNLSGAQTGSTTCAAGSFTFSLAQTIDGTYAHIVKQTDRAGNVSATSASFTWIRDTIVPAAVTITAPNSNPYVSGDTTFALSGGCETGTTVTLAGSQAGTTTCVSSAYSFTITKSSDATYNYTLSQTDLASNTSGTTSFQWVRNTSIPTTPTITAPTTNPKYTNTTPVTISGACTTGNVVTLDDGSALPPTYTCASNAYTFSTLPLAGAAQGTYSYYISQANAAGTSSSDVLMTIIKDTTAPAVPLLINPSSSPYTSGGSLYVTGTCEPLATVNVTGSTTTSATCSSSGTFSFTITGPTDLTMYTYSFTQTDRAANTSGSASLQWYKDNSVLTAPVISSPTTNPYITNTDSISIAGTCTTGYTVYLDKGTGSQQSQVCSASAFSFTVTGLSDATRSYSLLQSNGLSDSPAISQQWTRDTVAPSVTLVSAPANPNYSGDAIFQFTTDDVTSVAYCGLDGAAAVVCASPMTYSALPAASHTVIIYAVDPAGNIGTSASTTFTQMPVYSTVALYHFDTATGVTSGSTLYSSVDNNDISSNDSTTAASAKFGEAVDLTATTTGIAAVDSPTLGSISVGGKLTAEAWVNWNALPSTNNDYQVILGQNDASPNMGWELRLIKKGAHRRFIFVGSLNGTTASTIQSSTAVSSLLTTGVWHHVAVTFNLGSVRIYFNGQQVASGTIGTAGSSLLFNTTGDLRMGYGPSAPLILDAMVDEVRVSQTVRYLAPFTTSIPSTAFTAD